MRLFGHTSFVIIVSELGIAFSDVTIRCVNMNALSESRPRSIEHYTETKGYDDISRS